MGVFQCWSDISSSGSTFMMDYHGSVSVLMRYLCNNTPSMIDCHGSAWEVKHS